MSMTTTAESAWRSLPLEVIRTTSSGPLNGVPASPAFYQALLKAQSMLEEVARSEETEKRPGKQQWKFSRTDDWLKAARGALHPCGLVVTQGSSIEPVGSSGVAFFCAIRVVFEVVCVADGTGRWYSLTWPLWGEPSGPDLANRSALTLSWKYFLRGLLMVPQTDGEGDATEARDPEQLGRGSPTSGRVPPPVPVPDQRKHWWERQPHVGSAQSWQPGPAEVGGMNMSYGAPGWAPGGPSGSVAPGVPVHEEPIVQQARAMLDAAPAAALETRANPTPPEQKRPTDGGTNPSCTELVAAGWDETFCGRLAATDPDKVCPPALREAFLNKVAQRWGDDTAAAMAPWNETGFVPQSVDPTTGEKVKPTVVQIKRYLVASKWEQAPASS